MKKLKEKILQMKLNNKGFTLIELIIVIAIIGILAAIAVPAVNGYINKAKIKADISTAETLANAAITSIAVDGVPTDIDTTTHVSPSLNGDIIALISESSIPKAKVTDVPFIITIESNTVIVKDSDDTERAKKTFQ